MVFCGSHQNINCLHFLGVAFTKVICESFTSQKFPGISLAGGIRSHLSTVIL